MHRRAIGSELPQLRFIPSPDAESLLLKALASDASDQVRLQAAAALGLRPTTDASYAAQRKAFASDTSLEVRRTLLDNLWKAHDRYP